MKKELFIWISLLSGIIILAFILIPLIYLMTETSVDEMYKTILDGDVSRSIWLSIYTSLSASAISFIFGTPFAYFLVRTRFRGKRFIESLVDIPIVIPHPVVGIAILSIVGREHWIGQALSEFGIRIMGSTTGIIAVLTFVGMPFYINAAKNGFQSVSSRLEGVSRSLGASLTRTFFNVTFPLAARSMLAGFIMCAARSISEFGAVIIIAYHPMTAPVLIYERFESHGLRYSLPVCVWLIIICLLLFIALRMLTLRKRAA